ncbi:hypothetical protein PGT21_021987 [Puccinia graminis f. sp. tritici]|uniref:Uncharacterized protein n=1 Tax=Puccinia graminis f. sp. tritici TaxID=56615 RepID=A0A5B0MXE2_PUCGR|nr:hypothetical protein PGT21_021987 [Puccinia graminis f. sp. tritici]
MLLTKILVSLQLLHYYSISAHTESPLVKRSEVAGAAKEELVALGSGSSGKDGEAGLNENIIPAERDNNLVALKADKPSEINKQKAVEDSVIHENLLQKKLLESSESFLDGSLKVLGVEVSDEQKRSSILKFIRKKIEEIEEDKGGNYSKNLGGDNAVHLAESKYVDPNLLNNFFKGSLKYIGDLNEKDQGKVLELMRSNFEHIKENTYAEQLDVLLATLQENRRKLVESWERTNSKRKAAHNKIESLNERKEKYDAANASLTELQKEMLWQFVHSVRNNTPSEKGSLTAHSEVNYADNFEELWDVLQIYAFPEFNKIVTLLKIGKGTTDQKTISGLTHELMEVLPLTKYKRDMLELIQYVDLIMKTESLKYIPQVMLIELTPEQHELLQEVVHQQMPRIWRYNYTKEDYGASSKRRNA